MNSLMRGVFGVFLASGLIVAQASDLAKEKRWADQVVDAIFDGEAVWLNDGKNDFLGIFTTAQSETDRAVIIMHGTGVHPNWQQVVYPLRVGLVEHGWNTLSIQMPILANDADYKEYAPLYDEVPARIDAARSYLRNNGIKHIVLVGHSQGAVMAASYLRKHSDKLKGFVAIGMPGKLHEGKMNAAMSLEKFKLPVLDIYGSDDLENVLKSRGERMAAATRAGNKNYRQQEIADAGHFFDGKDDELVDAVASWLNP